jgi:pimeloyl-ACP methyl ester carboxylesterase
VPEAKLDGVTLAYTDDGEGYPLIWCHEYGGSMESWEPQVHYFTRRYRVITYNARGYPPSSVPDDPTAYSQDHAVDDLYQLLRHLNIDQAYIGGLSMGGACTLQFGIKHPEMARALIISAAGTGSDDPDDFHKRTATIAGRIEQGGMQAIADYSTGDSRIQLKRKDPTGWQTFADLFLGHSPEGAARTMRGVQGGRPPIYDSVDGMQALDMPALIMVGDEDDGCIQPALFMKANIPRAGLAIFPQSGHGINLEEPDLYNRTVSEFLAAVEAGTWPARDPGSGGGFSSNTNT